MAPGLLHVELVSHRIEIESGPQGALRIVFEGLLDAAAVGELTAACETRTPRGPRAVVVLRAGSVIDHPQLESLRSLDAEVVAESPYLARWLAEADGSARPSTASLRPVLRTSGARRTPRRMR